jgi:crotonobetainyl-CoA:carnitine CoA-transferase CaiB-like acyl-CoA transferase
LLLQQAGVSAGVVRAPYDLLQDPHLRARGFWTWIDHPFLGIHPQPAPAYRDRECPYPVPSHAPTLGQHNQEVLAGLLGLSQGEIDRLAQSHVIGTKALPPSMRKARAAVGATG